MRSAEEYTGRLTFCVYTDQGGCSRRPCDCAKTIRSAQIEAIEAAANVTGSWKVRLRGKWVEIADAIRAIKLPEGTDMTDVFAGSSGDSEGRHKGRRIGTLWTNADVDGDVTLTLDFMERTPLERLDLLSDVISLLEAEKEAVFKEWEQEFEAARSKRKSRKGQP